MPRERRRRICFITGTRAEFGLMRSTLQAIDAHPKLQLQIVATAMHLDATRGRSLDHIRAAGVNVDRVVRWPAPKSQVDNARQTGLAMARLAGTLEELKPDIVLVVGDRVEAFAAAAAGHLAGCIVAHVHGGDRALGQVDDSLRHAITKLAHVHFPATRHSARRIIRLGEDPWRVHHVGSPGLDELATVTSTSRASKQRRWALIVLHPVDASERVEYARARTVLRAVESIDFERIVIIYPNTDPGAAGIVRCWRRHARGSRFGVFPDLPRGQYLQLLRDAAVLVGNSSSGIIEAASFGTPVIDVGPRQQGRQRSQNVTNVPYSEAAVRRALLRVWRQGRPRRFRGPNVYGGGGAGRRMADILARLPEQPHTRRKLIAY